MRNRRLRLEEDPTEQSVLDCRRAYHEMTNKEFAAWYERRYRVPEKRVLAIITREEQSTCTE